MAIAACQWMWTTTTGGATTGSNSSARPQPPPSSPPGSVKNVVRSRSQLPIFPAAAPWTELDDLPTASRRVQGEQSERTTWIDFRGPPGNIPRVSALDVLQRPCSAGPIRRQGRRDRRHRPREPRRATERPLDGGRTCPDPEVQANAIDTMLRGSPLRDVSRLIDILAILVLASIPAAGEPECLPRRPGRGDRGFGSGLSGRGTARLPPRLDPRRCTAARGAGGVGGGRRDLARLTHGSSPTDSLLDAQHLTPAPAGRKAAVSGRRCPQATRCSPPCRCRARTERCLRFHRGLSPAFRPTPRSARRSCPRRSCRRQERLLGGFCVSNLVTS